MRVGNFCGNSPVLSDELKLFVDPIVRVNEKDVIAGTYYPAQSRLPAQFPAHRIVLDIIHQRNPGIELVPENHLDQAGGEVSFSQLDAIPFPFQTYEKPLAQPEVQIK